MITSGEYIQMSGRAGRRGKDDKGLVILMVDQQLSEDAVKKILMVMRSQNGSPTGPPVPFHTLTLQGQSDPLNSQFRLTYNMVLNILRVPDINPEFMLERSFYQFQNQARLPELHDSESQFRLSPFVSLKFARGFQRCRRSKGN
jgi:ATP-dependent RNA helicase DOB1